MFSKKMEYGYMIIKELKETDIDKRKFGKDILKNIDVPYNMGLGILSELSKSKVIISNRGQNKGYYLKDKKLTLLDLFNSLENINKVRNNNYSDSIYKNKVAEINKLLLKELKKIKILD